MLFLKEASSRLIGDLLGTEDGAVLKEGIEVLDELLLSDLALIKVVLMSFAFSLVHCSSSHNGACHSRLVAFQVYPD